MSGAMVIGGQPRGNKCEVDARFTGRAFDLSTVPGRGPASLTADRSDQNLGEGVGEGEYMKYEDVYSSEIVKYRTL